MAITIDENILIAVFAIILVPFIVFHLKLIIDFRVVKSQMETANDKLTKMEDEIFSINKLWNKVSVLEVHVTNLLRDRDQRGAPVNK